jgi:site-specific DNA-methyltransferase (adenine-specific)
MSNIRDFRYEWIWNKNRGTGIFNAKKSPMKSHENILVFYQLVPVYNPQMTVGKPYTAKQGKQSDGFGLDTGKSIITVNTGERYPLSSLYFASTNGHNVHPTQKPVALFEYLIRTYTNEGETVLDNCAGSGTTGVACINTDRKAILIEMSEDYCAISAARILKAYYDKQNSTQQNIDKNISPVA